MANKTVLLPRDWNDPGVPPENQDRVFIDLGNEIYEIGRYSSHRNNFYDNNWDEIDFDSIRGWAAILQQ